LIESRKILGKEEDTEQRGRHGLEDRVEERGEGGKDGGGKRLGTV